MDGWMDERVNHEQFPSVWLPVHRLSISAEAIGGQRGTGYGVWEMP